MRREIIGSVPHYYSDRLKTKLDQIRFALTTIVEAPSGFGKTTAIKDFLDKNIPQSAPVYWVTAIGEPPTAGFRRLCLEINKIDADAGKRLLQIELPNAANIGEASDAVRRIQCGYETYLVIDNFQYLQIGAAFLTALFEHGGKGLHIIFITQMLGREIQAAVTGKGFLQITAADLRLDAEDIRRYYRLAGIDIRSEDVQGVAHYTEGWMIAVYLQLCVYRETGSFSDTKGILALMEYLVWDKLTEAQQIFLLRLSPFGMVTLRQACALAECDTLPGYAVDALNTPFIRFDPAGRKYEMHSILAELLVHKREERGAVFEHECVLRAGDYCREEGNISEAFRFYSKAGNYEHMLSLDLSGLTLEMIGNTPFSELAADIAQNCPKDIKKRHILSMLRIAWALLTAGMNAPFDTLMEELRAMLDAENPADVSLLLGEWTLLSSFKSFPCLDKMTPILRQAAALFKGKCSQVILPAAPWCFGSYSPLAEFHIQPGNADREADELEEYVALYSRLTNGNGSGADALFRAELAYQRGDMIHAEIFAYKSVFLAESNQQSIVQLGATMQLAEIALHKADTAGWQNAISSMERAASFPSQNTFVTRSVLDIIRGVLLSELQHQMSIAEWLKNGETKGRLLPFMTRNALFVHLSFLMQQGEYARLIGTAQAIDVDKQGVNPLGELLLWLTLAAGYVLAGDKAQAALLAERAAQRSLPDGLIFPLASYSWLLQGLTDELIAKNYSEFLVQFNQIKERFYNGWAALREAMFTDGLPSDLTAREYEVAKLAAQGMHNSEIAKKLVVSENTVRAHLRTVFEKLDIDRRAKLAGRLK